MRRYFNILLGALAMIAVALVSAFITMRLSIHGRVVEVPSVAGLTVAEARKVADGAGLNFDVESSFYSTITPAGRILSQTPAPGTKVRRDWVLRVTESSGPQKVSVPNVVGETEREASVTIRRLSLELGTIAYLPSPGPSGIVLSQSPTSDAAGVDGPRISLLVSEPIPTVRPHPATFDDANPQSGSPESAVSDVSATASPSDPADENVAANLNVEVADGQPEAYVMPSLLGLSLSAATARVSAMGLHIASMNAVPSIIKPVAPVGSTTPSGAISTGQPAAPRPIAPIAPITLADTVVAQAPPAGHRVTNRDSIHITLSH